MTNTVTVIGNLGRDPELKYIPSGQPVVKFTVADTPRRFDKASNQWIDGETKWWQVEAWGTLAENLSKSVKKGDKVVVTGVIRAEKFKSTKTGEDTVADKLVADEVAVALSSQTAVATKSFGTARNDRQPVANLEPAGSDEDIPF